LPLARLKSEWLIDQAFFTLLYAVKKLIIRLKKALFTGAGAGDGCKLALNALSISNIKSLSKAARFKPLWAKSPANESFVFG
jgi:hypothetical protein